MSRLFQLGKFRLHAGGKSNFKIDCDALSDDELAALAAWVAPRLPPFDSVYGIPTGGTRMADAMVKYFTVKARRHLLVDDVYDTGMSMAAQLPALANTRGLVIFARQPPPAWITAIFVGQNP